MAFTLNEWGAMAEAERRTAKYLKDAWGINHLSKARLICKVRGKIHHGVCDWSVAENRARNMIAYDSWEPDTVWIYSIKERAWCFINMNLMEGRPGSVQICTDGEASIPKDILLYNALLEDG